MDRTFRNPILSGCYPDPSICRVDNDFYLVTSTFEYFPGLPIFRSRDLVHWEQIGHVLDRPSQLDLDEVRPSDGLYAPTIRHHEGVFFVINTLIGGKRKSGNFIVTATDPRGPWSDPFWLDDADGIDPSLFFDDDGRVWYTGNRRIPGGGRYDGHCEIWMRELDLANMRLAGGTYSLWEGALKDVIWPESPHLYKIDGRYYLLIAEGGTAHDHAVTIARSDAVTGPYVGYRRNPVLTHRNLGFGHPIVGVGHADLVDTPNGEWWMVLLAMRPYGGYYYNLGRETFLVPVTWEDGWPVACPGTGRIEDTTRVPDLPEHRFPIQSACDQFDGKELAPCWNFIRTPREDFWSLTERPGHLRLRLRPQSITGCVNPSFVGRRQRHADFSARTALEFTPRTGSECAGLVLVQNPDFHFRFVVTLDDGPVAVLVRREKGVESVIGKVRINAGKIFLRVDAYGQDYSFFVANEPERWIAAAEEADGRILSTPVAGGFVGAFIGMYASSQGTGSDNTADFDWFEYRGIDG
jgi:xylan 1,4-beta-xylosidase